MFNLKRYFIRQPPMRVNFFVLTEERYGVESRKRLRSDTDRWKYL
jgi:hypothetical protein